MQIRNGMPVSGTTRTRTTANFYSFTLKPKTVGWSCEDGKNIPLKPRNFTFHMINEIDSRKGNHKRKVKTACLSRQVNVDEHSEWVEETGVVLSKLPAFFIYKEGKLAGKLEGDAVTENKLAKFILEATREARNIGAQFGLSGR